MYYEFLARIVSKSVRFLQCCDFSLEKKKFFQKFQFYALKQWKTTEIKAESAICVQGKSITNRKVSCPSVLIFHFVSKIGKIGLWSWPWSLLKFMTNLTFEWCSFYRQSLWYCQNWTLFLTEDFDFLSKLEPKIYFGWTWMAEELP